MSETKEDAIKTELSWFDMIHEGDFVIVQKLHERTFGKLIKADSNR
jgi:hypothetical protein